MNLVFFPTKKTIIIYHLMKGLCDLGVDFRWVGTEALCPPHLYPLPYGLREKAISTEELGGLIKTETRLVFADPGHTYFNVFQGAKRIVLDSLDDQELHQPDLDACNLYLKCQLTRDVSTDKVKPFPYSTFTFPRRSPLPDPTRGIFFLGWDAKGSSRRREWVSALRSSSLPFIGGLFSRAELSPDPVPTELKHPRLYPIDLYQEMTKDFRINLAFGGNGPLSFRLYELLSLGCFVIAERLSTPILPRQPRDREHLVWFDSPAELVELCEYYLEHETERRTIAEGGYHFYWNFLTPLQIARYFLPFMSQ